MLGYAENGVPPWKYRLSTTAAVAPFAALNGAGVVAIFQQELPQGFCKFQVQVGNTLFVLDTNTIGTPPYGDPPAATLRWSLVFSNLVGPEVQRGNDDARLPDPVAVPPAITTLPLVGPQLIPNPVDISPLAWDA